MRQFCLALFSFLAVRSALGTTTTASPPCQGAAINKIIEIGCWGYKECVNNVVIDHECPTGQILYRDTMQCGVPIAGLTCNTNTPCLNVVDGMYPEVGDACKSYYRCYGGINVGVFYCPASTVFNFNIQGCDFPGNVEPPCGTAIPTVAPAAVIG